MPSFLLILKCLEKLVEILGNFTFLKLHKKHIFCKIKNLLCLVYLQHHKDQLEVVIWVKDHFKKGLCQKINILAFFHQNSAFEFPAIPRHSNL